MSSLIDAVEKRHRKAVELATIWDRWFPSLAGQASTEHWMVLLDDYEMPVLAEAIRRCAKQRLKTPMTVADMERFIAQIAPAIAGASR